MLHTSIMMMTRLMMMMMMMIKMHWFRNCKLQLICLFTAFVYSCVYACVFALSSVANLVCLPWWIVHGGASGLFWQTGGQVVTLNQSSLYLNWLCVAFDSSLNWFMFVAMAQKLIRDLTAHPLSNCLAFVIWLWQWHESTLSLPLSMLQPWGMTHLSLLCWIESRYLLVLKRELLSSKSS